MLRFFALLAVMMLTSCSGTSTTTSASSGASSGSPVASPSAPVNPTASATTTSSSSRSPSVSAIVPPLFEDDVPAGDVPAAALVPLQTRVIGAWYATTSAGEAIVVAWEAPGPDPFKATRGVVVWRRFDDGGPPWRPVWDVEYWKDEAVLGVDARVADVTGDGSEDVLIDGIYGATGTCGRFAVVDIAVGSEAFERDACDVAIEPSTDPPGLTVSEAVFAPGDAHCCPSATRVTVLTYAGDGTWTRTSRTLVPAT